MRKKLFNTYKTILIIFIITLSFGSCKSDDDRSCTQCESDQTVPFEVCREGNGNASVNGENTGTDYDVYLADLISAGATCGG